MRNDMMYHLLIFGLTFMITTLFFEGPKQFYKSNNVHRTLEPHYQAEKEYKKKNGRVRSFRS